MTQDQRVTRAAAAAGREPLVEAAARHCPRHDRRRLSADALTARHVALRAATGTVRHPDGAFDQQLIPAPPARLVGARRC